MSQTIFKDFAPLYWDAGLPVIPLYGAHANVTSAGKRPILNDWSQYGLVMPTEDVRAHWVNVYPDSNIGLPLGVASGLCAIDIDTEDEALDKALMEILPQSPWSRVGAKGRGLIYKFSGQRNFKLNGDDRNMICEFLGQGNQMVMPPSIHPKTMRPYTANAELWELVKSGVIPTLPDNIEQILRDLLGKKGIKLAAGGRSGPIDIVPEGERDVQMTRHAGYLANVVEGVDKGNVLTLQAAIDHMHNWCTQFTAKVGGDNIDPGKGIAKILEFLIKDLEGGKTLPEGWDNGLEDQWLEHASIVEMRKRNEVQRWTVNKARKWIAAKIAENPDDEDWAVARVMELLQLVSKDDKFDDFQMRALSPHLEKASDKVKIKKSDLLQGYKAAKKGVADGDDEWESHETLARIALEAMQRDGEVRFHHEQFWQWNGSCFKKLDTAKDVYIKIATTIKGSKLAQRHSDYAGITKVMAAMASAPLIESEDNGINFANGWVGEDLVLQDHAPKFGATFTLPFEYRPELAGRATRFFEFLTDCWGTEPDFDGRVKCLQELFAASLFGIAPNYQRAFLMFGRPGTGKTQVLRILRSLLPPDAIADLGPQFWGQQFALTQIIGKVVNICAELPESGTIAGNVFKQVVEGSECPTEYKGRDIFVFKPRCAHWFASNFFPTSRDSSGGFARRWIILDFNHVVPADKVVRELAESIVAEEREAIAAWAMEGLKRLLKNGDYTQPSSHDARMKQLRTINNSVKAFFEQDHQVKRDPNYDTMVRELYDKYGFYIKNMSRGTPVGFERFVQMLEDLDVNVRQEDDGMGNYEWIASGIRIVGHG
jgi:P4 family phage/plasmid primase-like protien